MFNRNPFPAYAFSSPLTLFLPRFPASPLPRFSCFTSGQREGFSGFHSADFAGGGDQLTQDLGRGLGAALTQLGHGRGKRAPERRRHGKTGEPVLQGLDPAAMGSIERGRAEEKILSHSDGKPQREESTSLGAASGLRQEREQGARRRIPLAHGISSQSAR